MNNMFHNQIIWQYSNAFFAASTLQ